MPWFSRLRQRPTRPFPCCKKFSNARWPASSGICTTRYKQLVTIAEEEGDVALEELAREYVRTEQEHHDEVNKMLRSPR